MKKLMYIVCLIVIVGCKEEVKKETNSPIVEDEKTIVLSNYSDENWNNGVAIELNMFLVDLTDTNRELLKDIKELELVDGTIVKVTGTTVADPFIQINTEEKADLYKEKASYPNVIFIR